MGKFGLRGLAQSLARELHPKNIHIGHFVIDGGIGNDRLALPVRPRINGILGARGGVSAIKSCS